MALKQAQSTPLDLLYIQWTNGLRLQDFFREVESRIDQWNSLVVEAEKLEGLCTPIETLVPPQLQKLHLSRCDERRGLNIKMQLFGGRPAPPSLKDVSFSYVDPIFPSLCLAGVTSFELYDVHGPSEADFVDLLQSSPTLTRIRLVSTSFQPSGEGGRALSVEPIRLVALVTLSVKAIRFEALHFILSCIDGPALQTLEILSDMNNGQTSFTELFDVDTQHLLTPLKSSISTSKESKVSFWARSEVRLSVGGFEIGVGYQWTRNSYLKSIFDCFEESVDWLKSHVDCDIRDRPVHLELQNTYPTLENLQWFTSYITVYELTVLGTTFVADCPAVDVLQVLSSSDTSSTPTLPLPNLEVISLEIVEYADLRRVAQYIQGVADQRRRSAQKVPAVGRLRELRLSAFHNNLYSGVVDVPVAQDNELLRNIKEAAGGLQIYWEGMEWNGTD
ncbi:hypothetical protein FRB90_006025 [Tulasnella sp. 427]|nr:hypothetical protein FRB90_006025 [Tulasnella sp. 427]